jgi:hypothetical protein
MNNYEVVYTAVCKLGHARLDRIVAECNTSCRMSRRTVSNSIRLLEMDYMVSVKNKVWHSTSAGPKTLGKAAKSGQLGKDRSLAFCRDDGKTASRDGLPEGILAAFRLEEPEDAAPAPLRGPAGCQVVVNQDADLPVVMRHIVDELVSARTKHNRLEGVRTMRAKISRKKRRKNLLDTEVTHDLSVLARLLWVAMKTSTWETDPNFRAWLTADMNRLVPGWRDKVNQAVVEIAEAA